MLFPSWLIGRLLAWRKQPASISQKRKQQKDDDGGDDDSDDNDDDKWLL